MNLTSLFENEADALKVEDDQISGIAALARRAKSLEKQISDAEDILKGHKEQYRKLTEETIPEALSELGMTSFRMDDGSSIEVKPFYSASISEARRAEAFQWLRDHGFDDIIKNTVSVRFGRGEDELCNRLLGMLGQQGFPAEQSEKVEPSTLKAWVKERVTRGDQFPMELFGAYIGKKASIKS
jgi:hypothetical protein